MTSSEQYLICSKHNRSQFIDKTFSKNAFICINRYCQYSFQLACNRCRTQFHRDHIAKFLSLDTFKILIQDLLQEEPKRSTQQGYDYHKRLNIIRDFRKRMQVIQAQLGESIHDVITGCVMLDDQYGRYNKEIEEYGKGLERLDGEEGINMACVILKEIGKVVDYNVKKGILEYQSPKLKQLQQKVRKSLDRSSKQMQQMKQHTMKIIQVILHQLQSDDQIQLNIIRKKFRIYLQKQTQQQNKLSISYKQILDQLVQDINKKSNQLESWLTKAEQQDPKIREQYGDCMFVKVYEIAEENAEIHGENQLLGKENDQLTEELDDLRKKVIRMNERIGEYKKALFEEDQKFRVLKGEYEKLTGKVYVVPECAINIDLLRSEAMKLASTSQQRLDLLKNRNSLLKVPDNKQPSTTTNTTIISQQSHTINFTSIIEDTLPLPLPDHSSSRLTISHSGDTFVSQSRIIGEEKREMLITHMLGIITEQQKANERWVGICQSKNQTISSLKGKLKDLIESSRQMILSQ